MKITKFYVFQCMSEDNTIKKLETLYLYYKTKQVFMIPPSFHQTITNFFKNVKANDKLGVYPTSGFLGEHL